MAGVFRGLFLNALISGAVWAVLNYFSPSQDVSFVAVFSAVYLAAWLIRVHFFEEHTDEIVERPWTTVPTEEDNDMYMLAVARKALETGNMAFGSFQENGAFEIDGEEMVVRNGGLVRKVDCPE